VETGKDQKVLNYKERMEMIQISNGVLVPIYRVK